jgi:enterochelin esterase family protein
MIPPLYVSQTIDARGRVTFKVSAPDAASVAIEFGRPDGPEREEKAYALAKGDDGEWSVTTRPLPPGFHYYSIVIDGLRCSDPAAPCYFGWGHWCSGLDIPDPSFTIPEPRNVPHGDLRMHWYHSEICGCERRCVVYTPPGYDTSTQRYPVLYLQHGSGEAEFSWPGQGRANHIMDNLLDAKRAGPMLVVMDRGYAPPPGAATIAHTDNRFADVVVGELVPEIDRSFRTIADRSHRAIAGLSMGAGQAMRIGFGNLALFGSVGAMSGGGRGFDPATSFDGVFSNAAVANESLDLLWMGCGRQDGGFASARAMHETLESLGVRHVWFESEGAHEWSVWRRHLADFAPRLFAAS